MNIQSNKYDEQQSSKTEVTHPLTESPELNKETPITTAFKNYAFEKAKILKASHEYSVLKGHFSEIAEAEFNKNIYSNKFESKNDKLKNEFITTRTSQLLESFLKGIDLKSNQEIVAEMRTSWLELAEKLQQNSVDMQNLEAASPFGKEGYKDVSYANGLQVRFSVQSGKFSALVNGVEYKTKASGVEALLQLHTSIILKEVHGVTSKSTLSKIHRLALDGILQKAHPTQAIFVTAQGLGNLAERGEGFKIAAETHNTAGESKETLEGPTLPEGGSEHTSHLSQAAAAAGGLGVTFGALTVAEGLALLVKALHRGISDAEFLHLYQQFKQQVEEQNPPLSDTEKFELQELEKCVQTLRAQSKTKALASEGVLNVLLGSASIMAGSGTLLQVTTLAAAGTGALGGLLIVSGSAEMAAVCQKLKSLNKRQRHVAEVQSSTLTEVKGAKAKEGPGDAYLSGLVKSFMEIQADMIDHKKNRQHLKFTHGGGSVAGGTLLVAGAVAGAVTGAAGAVSFGAGAAVVLGGVAVGVVAGHIYLDYKDHKIQKLQTKLLAQDIAQARAAAGSDNPYRNMRSTAGKLMEIYATVKSEQANKRLNAESPSPISDHIVQKYMQIHPEAFLAAMQNLDEHFLASAKDTNQVGTGVYIKQAGLLKALKTTLSHSKDAAAIRLLRAREKLHEIAHAPHDTSEMKPSVVREQALQAKKELRRTSALTTAHKRRIEKELNIQQKEIKAISLVPGKLRSAHFQLNELNSKIAKFSNLKPPDNPNFKIEPRREEQINHSLVAIDHLLTEISHISSAQADLSNQNQNIEFEALTAIQEMKNELIALKQDLDFAGLNSNIKSRVDTYNYIQAQYEIVQMLSQQLKNGLDLLKSTVNSSRELNRAQYAIKDAKQQLEDLG